jgi:hypothetical protein
MFLQTDVLIDLNIALYFVSTFNFIQHRNYRQPVGVLNVYVFIFIMLHSSSKSISVNVHTAITPTNVLSSFSVKCYSDEPDSAICFTTHNII